MTSEQGIIAILPLKAWNHDKIWIEKGTDF